MNPNPLILRACAKINVGLDVLRKRPDGYHDIQSIFVAIDLCDTLTFELQPQPEVVCRPDVTTTPEDNIVFKAARAYHAAFPNDLASAKITVDKAIPTGGGLGGGSSDAASTLIGLAMLNGKMNSAELQTQLEPIAQSLGSDVPFFLRYGIAHVSGRGEIVKPLAASVFPWTMLIVCPGIHVNTAQAYSTLGITCEQPQTDLIHAYNEVVGNNSFNTDHIKNDFERSVFAQHPILATIKRALYEAGATYASMSGSGSTMYGLFTDVENAAMAQQAFAPMRTYICAPVTETYRIP